MKILITDGCGFLGSNLESYAIKKGFEVVFDNPTTGWEPGISARHMAKRVLEWISLP